MRRDDAQIPSMESSSMNTTTPKITGTIAEAAEVLGIGRNQAYEAAHRGDIPVIRIGKTLRVKWKEFLKMLGAAS